MLAIIHALVGGLIAEEFHSTLLILILSFSVHFLMDMVPHWDGDFDRKRFKMNGEVKIGKKTIIFYLADGVIALSLVIGLTYIFHNKMIFFGALAGAMPDLMCLGYKTKLKKSKKFMKFLHFHSKIQRETTWRKSAIIQLTIIAILLLIFVITYF